MFQCPRCATPVAPEARFCDACGTPLTRSGPPSGAPPHFLEPQGPPRYGTPHVDTPGARGLITGHSRTARPTITVVCAAFVAGIGVLFLVGAITPFVSFGELDGAVTLAEGNGSFAFAVVIASLLCIGACVGELLGLREALLVGTGVAAGAGSYSALTVATLLLFGDANSMSIGAFAWVLVALAAIATTVMLAFGVVPDSDHTASPVAFAGCSMGGGILLSLALLLSPPNVAFRDHMSYDEPFVTILTLLYIVVPTLLGVASMVARHRAIHVVSVGVVSWYGLEWAHTGLQARAFFSEADLGAQFYLQALALLLFGLSAIGGGLIRWHGTSTVLRSTRDYVLPISATSVLAVVVLAGLVG